MSIEIHPIDTSHTAPHLQIALRSAGEPLGEEELLMDEDGVLGQGQGGPTGAEKGLRSKAEALAMNRALIGKHFTDLEPKVPDIYCLILSCPVFHFLSSVS
jgi:hypothetical protein